MNSDQGNGPELAAEGRKVGRRLAAARKREADAITAARTWAQAAHQQGISEAELAELLGVDRAKTIRRWLGKG